MQCQGRPAKGCRTGLSLYFAQARQASVKRAFCLACIRNALHNLRIVLLGSIACRCAPSVVKFLPSLLALCCCLLPITASLSLLPCALCCLPFAGAFCLWLICLSLPSQRLCLPGCDRYYKAAKLAEALQREHHYTVDEKQKSVLLTEQGYEDAEDVLEVWVALGSVHLLISSPSGSVPRTAMF